MKKILVLTVFALPSLAYAKSADELVANGSPEQKAQAVVEELARRNTGWHDFYGDVEMDLEDPSGGKSHRSFTVKALEKPNGNEGDRSLIVFGAPSDIKGTAVLSHAHGTSDDEQWLYLPTAHRTKRISAGNRSGSFAGSEFSFEDLTASDPRKYAWRYAGKDSASNLVLEAVPKDATSAYSKRVVHFDSEMRAQSVDFYDRKGQKLKALTYGDYQRLGAYWRAGSWSMKNAQSGKGTTLRFSHMKVQGGYTSSDFSPERLGS